MNLYKVEFDNNVPASASKMYNSHFGSMKTETVDGRRKIEWLTIYADSEKESLNIAGKVIKDFFCFLKLV